MADGIAVRLEPNPGDRDPRLFLPEFKGITGDDVVRIGDRVMAGYFRHHPSEAQRAVLSANADEVRGWVEDDLASGRNLTELQYDFGRSVIDMMFADGEDPLSLLPLDPQPGTTT